MRQLVSQRLLDLLLDAVCAVKPSGEFVFVSAAFERIFGYAPSEVVGRNMMEFIHPDDLAATLAAANRVMDGHLQFHFENRYVRKDGSPVHLRWTARYDAEADLRIAVAHDISELKRSQAIQAALYAISEAAHTAQDMPMLFAEVHRTIGRLMDAAHFSVLLHDPGTDQLAPAYHASDRGPAPAAGRLADDVRCARLLHEGVARLDGPGDAANDPHTWLGAPLLTQDGAIGALVLQGYGAQCCYTEADKDLLQFIASQVARAIERKRMHVRLQMLADHDQLTQLPNRRCLMERLRQAIVRAQAQGGAVSLLFLDLDDFKRINDTLGHASGDQLLQQVGQRLQDNVRTTDLVARLGGDEFVVLLEHDGPADADTRTAAAAQKIRAAFEPAFALEGHGIAVRASMGAAHYPHDGRDAQQLLSHADQAMYSAKPAGAGRMAAQ